ncbi:cyclic nucleotide-binding/CBS domain-containing protein [Thermoproteota archaeon]
MKIKDIMHEIVRVPHNVRVADVAVIMDERSTGSVLLEDNGKPVGLITERDILRKVVAKKLNPYNVKALDIASFPLITVPPDESLCESARKMGENNIRRIFVEENGRILGKVTSGAITKNVKYVQAERIVGQRF